jgi:hypothetical protein
MIFHEENARKQKSGLPEVRKGQGELALTPR